VTSDVTYAIHVDCDPLWIYEREYGIELEGHDAIYNQALPDFIRLCANFGIRATFFMVGQELETTACSRFCQLALSRGHTIGNHSYTHTVKFAALTDEERDHEIRLTHARLIALGAVPRGYRSPGYVYSPGIHGTLRELDYRYDSSILPGPASLMMSAYLGVIGKSRKSFGVRRNLFASRRITNLGGSLACVPIAVMPFLRMPVHTTFAYQFGARYLDVGLSLLARSRGHHVLLFHAIDLLKQPADSRSAVIPLRKSFDERHQLVSRMLSLAAPKSRLTEELLA